MNYNKQHTNCFNKTCKGKPDVWWNIEGNYQVFCASCVLKHTKIRSNNAKHR
jgi:hypothetical protein